MTIRTHSPTRHAFTLIELLVVLSIISLLIAILLPVLSTARAAAQATLCGSNQRQIAIALSTYANEFKSEAIVFGRSGSGGLAGWPFYISGNNSATTLDTLDLVSDPTIFGCPSIERTSQILDQLGNSNEAYGLFAVDDGRPDPEFAYGSTGGSPSWHSHNLELVPRASDYLWGTCVLSTGLAGDNNPRLRAWFNQRLGSPPNPNFSLGGSGGRAVPIMIHEDAANAMFYDGHVERQKAQDMRDGPLELYEFLTADFVRFDLP